MDFLRDLRGSLIERKKRLFVNIEMIGSFKIFLRLCLTEEFEEHCFLNIFKSIFNLIRIIE